MRTTRKAISKAIKAKFNLDISVRGSTSEGCYHFYSDDDETGMLLSSLYSTTVYVYRLSDISVDRWVEEFESIISGNNEFIARGRSK